MIPRFLDDLGMLLPQGPGLLHTKKRKLEVLHIMYMRIAFGLHMYIGTYSLICRPGVEVPTLKFSALNPYPTPVDVQLKLFRPTSDSSTGPNRKQSRS